MAMKRRTKTVLGVIGGILLVIVLGIGGLGYATFGGMAPLVDGQRVGATVEVVQDGFVSVDILDLGEGHVALVDCGNDPAGAAILAALARRSLDPEDVTAILLTHGHGDHTAGCSLFTHAAIYVLAADVDLTEGRTAGQSPLSHLMTPEPTGVHVTHPLANGETITLGNAEVSVYAVPGHTAGSAAYLTDGTLFVGDSAGVTSAHTLAGAPWLFSDSTAENHASLRSLGERLANEHQTINALVPAHSGAMDEGDVIAALQGM